MSLIRDPARGTRQFYLLHFFYCIQTVFPIELTFTIKLLTPQGLFQTHLIGGLVANVTMSRIKKKKSSFCICNSFVYVTPWQPDPQKSCPP